VNRLRDFFFFQRRRGVNCSACTAKTRKRGDRFAVGEKKRRGEDPLCLHYAYEKKEGTLAVGLEDGAVCPSVTGREVGTTAARGRQKAAPVRSFLHSQEKRRRRNGVVYASEVDSGRRVGVVFAIV